MRSVLAILSLGLTLNVFADEPSTSQAAAVESAPSAGASVAAPVPAAAAAPSPAVPSCADIKAFKDKLHIAINAALRYPAELSFHTAQGVTIVGYDYQDGKVSDVRVTQPSNDSRLDRTALRAVQNADYASITPGIGSLKLHDSVIIVFDNSANTEKNVAEQKKKDDEDGKAKDSCD